MWGWIIAGILYISGVMYTSEETETWFGALTWPFWAGPQIVGYWIDDARELSRLRRYVRERDEELKQSQE